MAPLAGVHGAWRVVTAQPKAARTPGSPRPELLPAAMRGPSGGAVQAKAGPGAGEIRAARLLPGQVRLVGTGAALVAQLRSSIEELFQTDLSTVRVHEGPAASAIGAAAFTLGEDIYFAPGLFAPRTPSGIELLGHELAHVIQQRQGRVQNPFSDGVAVVQDPALEAEADEIGRRLRAHMAGALHGARGTSIARPGPPPMPARSSGSWPEAWIRSVTAVAQPSVVVAQPSVSVRAPLNVKGGPVPGLGKRGKGGGGGKKGGGGGKKGGGGGGGKKWKSKKKQQGIGGVQATSYRWTGAAWAGASGPWGAQGMLHAEQVAFAAHANRAWVGITQNAFPCANQCIAAFDHTSNQNPQNGGGIVFNITADHGNYSADWGGQAAPCTIYFVGGNHAVRGANLGEPGPPP